MDVDVLSRVDWIRRNVDDEENVLDVNPSITSHIGNPQSTLKTKFTPPHHLHYPVHKDNCQENNAE